MSSLEQAALANPPSDKSHAGQRPRLATAYNALIAGLALGLLHGLLYVFLVPPWQHYDEPNHFEYAWVAAFKPEQLAAGQRDPELERRLVESMLASGFYRGAQPPDLSPGAVVRLPGYSQREERPYYYTLLAATLRALPEAGLENQLYVGRLVSLLFYLLTIFAAWGLVREITAGSEFGGAAWLVWALPVTLALLPGFVDMMTAVNNDTAAVGFFSLFLWASMRLVRLGFNSWGAGLILLAAVLTGALAALVKSTALVALPLLGLALLLAVWRGRFRRIGWVLVLLLLAGAPFALLTTGDAAAWHRSAVQAEPTRLQTGQAPLGAYAFLIEPGQGTTPTWAPALFQPVPPVQVEGLQGKTVTIGVWAWADRPVEVRSPALWVNETQHVTRLGLDSTPRFFSLAVDVPADTWRIWITLHPGPVEGPAVKIYYDGLVLAEGSRPLSPPQNDGDEGLHGDWGGAPFTNLARNPSAEQAGLRWQPWVERLGARLLPDRSHPSLWLTAPLDGAGTGWFYRDTGAYLLRTWWGMFGWGHVPLPGARPYRALALLTAAAVAGALAALWRGGRSIHWPSVAFLAAVLVAVWGAAWLRGSIYLGLPRLLWSPARYAAPAILPTALIFSAGSLHWLGWLPFLRSRPAVRLGILLGFLASLALLSTYTLYTYYY